MDMEFELGKTGEFWRRMVGTWHKCECLMSLNGTFTNA